MKNFKQFKQYIGLALSLVGVIGGFLGLLFTLGFDVGTEAIYIFSPDNGSQSLAPIMFGILACAGVWLLTSIDDE